MLTFSRLSRYGASANIHDGWKFLAILLMSIDHFGLFLEAESLWWRALGRGAYPIFAFLAGYYAHSSRTGWLWLMAFFMQGFHMAVGGDMLPLNILFSILICRFLAQRMQVAGWWQNSPLISAGICLLFALPSYLLFEYGTVGLMMSGLGVMVREGYKARAHHLFCVFTIAVYVGSQQLLFGFSMLQLVCVTMLSCAVLLPLWYRGLAPFSQGRIFQHHPMLDGAVRLLGRYSLEYYVLHRMVLQGIAFMMLV